LGKLCPLLYPKPTEKGIMLGDVCRQHISDHLGQNLRYTFLVKQAKGELKEASSFLGLNQSGTVGVGNF